LLMELPMCFLDVVEYDNLSPDFGEFAVRKRYIDCYEKHHQDPMTKEMKREVLKNCTQLNYDELKELRSLDVLSNDELVELYDANFKRMEKEAKITSLLSLGASTSSSTSSILTADQYSSNGGAIYDPVHKIILSVSGGCNNGRNLKITQMSDGTHGKSTVSAGVIPFQTAFQYPLFDGTKFTYFFQHDNPGNRFGRVNMDTLTFEELPSLPSGIFLHCCGGCIHNDNIYVINNSNKICEYCVKTQEWKTLNITVPARGRLLNNPNDSEGIYAIFSGQRFSRINLENETISDLCKPPLRYDLEGGNQEGYLISLPYCFIIFASLSSVWHMYHSASDKWIELPKWKRATNFSAHFVYVPEEHTAFYHVQGCTSWEMVSFSGFF